MTLEKRGYATAGSWTPEAAAEHPEAIEQVEMTMVDSDFMNFSKAEFSKIEC